MVEKLPISWEMRKHWNKRVCQLCISWRLKTLEWKFLQIVFAQHVCCDKRWENRWQQIREILKYLVCFSSRIFWIFWLWVRCVRYFDLWRPCFQSWLKSRSCQVWRIIDKRPFSTRKADSKHCPELILDGILEWEYNYCLAGIECFFPGCVYIWDVPPSENTSQH